MIINSTLMHDGVGSTPYYTPPFLRDGQAATFAIDVTHFYEASSMSFLATVEHKNEADTAWGSAGAFSAITGVGVATKDITSLKEQIRIAFTFPTGAAGDFVAFVVAAPAWREYD